MKSAVLWLLLCVGTLFGLTGGVAWGTCAGDENVAGEWIFEPVAEMPGWALNAGVDGDMGNLGLTGGATFSTNVPTVNGSCAHSLCLSWANTAAELDLEDSGQLSIRKYGRRVTRAINGTTITE